MKLACVKIISDLTEMVFVSTYFKKDTIKNDNHNSIYSKVNEFVNEFS